MKDILPEAYEALVTHSKRYEIWRGKLDDNTNAAVELGSVNMDIANERIEILTELTLALIDRDEDLRSIIEEVNKVKDISNTALHAYTKVYGSKLEVPEGFIEFGHKFNIHIDVIPKPGVTKIKVEIEEDKNDSKHNRRRTYYQKIRDWFIFFRQGIREPKR